MEIQKKKNKNHLQSAELSLRQDGTSKLPLSRRVANRRVVGAAFHANDSARAVFFQDLDGILIGIP